MNDWGMYQHENKRQYSPLENEWVHDEMYDAANAMGHILRPVEMHPTNGLVRLYRCAGCAGIYRVHLAGSTQGVWDAPWVDQPAGRCPASYDGVLALASGEEGGLQLWGEGYGPDDWNAIVTTECDEQWHRNIRFLEGRRLPAGSLLSADYCTPHMWQCLTCGRLVAKLSNPCAERSQLWLSYVTCGGPKATLRGSKR